MPFSELDAAGVARALAQIAEREEDLVDAYFERCEEIELPPEAETPGLRVRREEGLAVRLVRGNHTWLAARDAISPRLFAEALRQVARALPSAAYPEPALMVAPWQEAPAGTDLVEFPVAVERAIRAQHVAFPVRLAVRRHRRHLQVVGPRLVPSAQRELFFSCSAETAWGRYGALLPLLDEAAAGQVAAALVGLFRARQAASPAAGRGNVVLGPAATAVFLHEAVAHALETDVLARGGRPEAAVGVIVGAPDLDVLDSPAEAPQGVQRETDDEGVPVVRRWLLRGGRVEQPLADRFWARGSTSLLPGAARRGSRHLPPGPRSTHLELLPGDQAFDDLLAGAEGGLFFPEASRGSLDAQSGRFSLALPFGRRIRSGAVAEPVAAAVLTGRVADLLGRVVGVGREVERAGAGWCAKDGQKLAVWASAPPLLLDGVELVA
jgi:PmbA/TldA metallopeptidase C-terminal domain